MTLHERLDTRVNVQNLLSAIAIAGGLVTWAISIDSRVSALESTKKAQELVDARQDVEANRRQDQILTAVRDLDAKVVKVIERRKS